MKDLALTVWSHFGTLGFGKVKIGSCKRKKVAMTKSELIQNLADANPHLYQRDVERIVTTIFDEITTALADGNRVELRGFGAFSIKERGSRVGRNPRSGEVVNVAAKRLPYFKTGKLLREKLNS